MEDNNRVPDVEASKYVRAALNIDYSFFMLHLGVQRADENGDYHQPLGIKLSQQQFAVS